MCPCVSASHIFRVLPLILWEWQGLCISLSGGVPGGSQEETRLSAPTFCGDPWVSWCLGLGWMLSWGPGFVSSQQPQSRCGHFVIWDQSPALCGRPSWGTCALTGSGLAVPGPWDGTLTPLCGACPLPPGAALTLHPSGMAAVCWASSLSCLPASLFLGDHSHLNLFLRGASLGT